MLYHRHRKPTYSPSQLRDGDFVSEDQSHNLRLLSSSLGKNITSFASCLGYHD